MKIFGKQKTGNTITFRFLGIVLYKKTTEYTIYDSTHIIKSFESYACGLLQIHKEKRNFGYYAEKNIFLSGISVSKKVEQGNVKTKYFCGRIVKQKSNIDELKKTCLNYFDDKYDDIYVLNANSGEIYLFLSYVLDAFIKKNGSKNPLLVATKKYHLDIVKMICPEIPVIYLDKPCIKLKDDCTVIDNFRFFVIFSDIYFRTIEYNIKNNPVGEYHYFSSIIKHTGVSEKDLKMRKAIVPADSEKSMLEKVSEAGLNIDNFVIIAPEAKSCELVDNQFWIDLINGYRNANYDIYVNLADNIVDLTGVEYKSCFLTYSELFALGQKAKKIISLRSGLTEFLLQTNAPTDVLYTKFRMRPIFKDMPVEHVMSGFGIKKIKDVNLNKVREFNVEKYDNSSLLQEILSIKENHLCQK